jgi:hypothetical protein
LVETGAPARHPPTQNDIVLVASVRKQHNLQISLNRFLQVVSVNIFEQTPPAELLASKTRVQEQIAGDHHAQNWLWPNE